MPTQPLLYPTTGGAARLDCISLFEGSGTVQVNEAALLTHDAGEERLVVSKLGILKALEKGVHSKVLTGVKMASQTQVIGTNIYLGGKRC